MKIAEVFNLRAAKGEVGVEVEMEGVNLPDALDRKHWSVELDGSLRGESYEYVFNGPADKQLAFKRLDYLRKVLDERKSGVADTGRAGVHVHVNVQDLTPKQVACFICMYYIFENTLLKFCGEDRVGNLFCLRTCDAEGALPVIIGAFNHPHLRGFGTDDIRYAALNLNSLPKYGSVEFRAMKSTGDMEVIKKWIEMLLNIKEYSLSFDKPTDVVEGMSLLSPLAMFREVFGEDTPLEYDEDDMYEGVRYAQDLAYGVDWDRLDVNQVLIRDGYATAEGDV